MLFNLVLIPIEVFLILMIYKIKNNITELNFEPKMVKVQTEYLYDLDEEFIEKYNRNYTLPPIKIGLFLLIVMSIAVTIFERELYHKVVTVGFFMYFVIFGIYFILGKINLNKRRI